MSGHLTVTPRPARNPASSRVEVAARLRPAGCAGGGGLARLAAGWRHRGTVRRETMDRRVPRCYEERLACRGGGGRCPGGLAFTPLPERVSPVVLGRAGRRRRVCSPTAPKADMRVHAQGHERQGRAVRGPQGPGRADQLLGHLVRPVPDGDAVAGRPAGEVPQPGIPGDRHLGRRPARGHPAVRPRIRASTTRCCSARTARTCEKAFGPVFVLPMTVIIGRDGTDVHQAHRSGREGAVRKRDQGAAVV